MLKPCPFCGEQIQSAAVKCRFCGEWLDPSRRPDASAPPAAAEQSRADVRPADVRHDPQPEPWAPPPAPITPTPAPAAVATAPVSLAAPLPPPHHDPDPHHRSSPAESSPLLVGLLATRPEPHASHLSPGTGSFAAAPTAAAAPAPIFTAGPLPSATPASNLSSGPADPPAPRSAASRLADFERAFLDTTGDDDSDSAGSRGGDDDPFTSVAPQRPPPPWGLIGAVVGGVLLIAVVLFKNELFPPEIPADPPPVADTKIEPTAKEIKLDPPPEQKLADAKSLPIQPPPQPTGPLAASFPDQLAKARAAYLEGRLKVAASSLAELAKAAPDHPEVLLLTAQIQLEENKFAESQKTADRCVFVDPKLADCWLTLGVLRQNSHDNPGAVTAYETYLKLAPSGRYAHDASSQLNRLRPRGAAVPTPAPASPAPAPTKSAG